MKAGKMILFFVAGGLFGTGLAISGMTDPARVIGFLDLFGAWDPALLFVMAGAVGVYGLGMLMLRRVENRDLQLPSPTPSPIDRQLIVGSAIFGVGWGLGGFCPGLHSPIWALFASKHYFSFRRWRSACSWPKDFSEPTDSRSSEVDVGYSRFTAARNQSAIDMEMVTARWVSSWRKSTLRFEDEICSCHNMPR